MAKIQQVERDVRERGRDMSGCIKQWLNFVKPNFSIYVQPQRDLAGEWPVTLWRYAQC